MLLKQSDGREEVIPMGSIAGRIATDSSTPSRYEGASLRRAFALRLGNRPCLPAHDRGAVAGMLAMVISPTQFDDGLRLGVLGSLGPIVVGAIVAWRSDTRGR